MFRLVLPLPFPGLRRVNAYLLRSERHVVLVDCGLHDPNLEEGGWKEVVTALAACDARPDEIEALIVTHPHIDHYGMAGTVVQRTGCELWMHERASEDLDLYRDPQTAIAHLKDMLSDHGVGPREAEELTAFEDLRGLVSSVVEPSRALKDGEGLRIGRREWEVIFTPGHSRSHICLWAADERILVSGDHLLPGITPQIDFRRGGDVDPLGEYLQSLDRIEELDPALVLPGHGRPFEEGADRARITARHHERRLGAIVQVIRTEPKTADEITDEIFGTTLLDFQRRLALGEALAHLAYLRRRGEIERTKSEDGVFVYRKVDRRRREDGE